MKTPGPVIIDARTTRRRETGGARYAQGLVDRFLGGPPIPTVRVVRGPRPLPRKNALTSVGNLVLDLLWTHVALPIIARRHRASAIHATFNWAPFWAPCPRIVTVHDLIWERFPGAYPSGFRRFAQIFTRASVRRSQAVIAVSHATADDIHAFYGTPRERISVVYTGIDGIRDDPDELAAIPRERIVLHVGEFEPRKRVPMLVEGFSRFAATPEGRGWRLMLVGRGGSDEERVRAAVAECPACEMAGRVSDDALHALYRRAMVIVSASRWEGFGLPIAEAALEGCAVMVADTPALREAGGPASQVIPEPVNPDAIAEACTALVSDGTSLEQRAQQCQDHARRFTWNRCIAGTRNVYSQVVNR